MQRVSEYTQDRTQSHTADHYTTQAERDTEHYNVTIRNTYVVKQLEISRETCLSPPVKCFTDRTKAVLLLWIIHVFLSCVCYAFVRFCLFVP